MLLDSLAKYSQVTNSCLRCLFSALATGLQLAVGRQKKPWWFSYHQGFSLFYFFARSASCSVSCVWFRHGLPKALFIDSQHSGNSRLVNAASASPSGLAVYDPCRMVLRAIAGSRQQPVPAEILLRWKLHQATFWPGWRLRE